MSACWFQRMDVFAGGKGEFMAYSVNGMDHTSGCKYCMYNEQVNGGGCAHGSMVAVPTTIVHSYHSVPLDASDCIWLEIFLHFVAQTQP